MSGVTCEVVVLRRCAHLPKEAREHLLVDHETDGHQLLYHRTRDAAAAAAIIQLLTIGGCALGDRIRRGAHVVAEGEA